VRIKSIFYLKNVLFQLLDVTKFFGCELGAQVQPNAKVDRYIVNGAHNCEKLQHLLDGFIKRFVLCPNCANPETKLVC
jgi:translation initiation factor 5